MYIWNVEATTKVVRMLKRVAPDVIVVLGGPEVSYEAEAQAVVGTADYVIAGPGDRSFSDLCRKLLQGHPPATKTIRAAPPAVALLELPYRDYTEADIAHRLIYVEASRGCPFRCEFCLSALDDRVTPFELERFLGEMEALYDRGARHFKFVDRTFNLRIDVGIRVLEFFLERLDEQLFLHFELIPDRLPERLKEVAARFPKNSLQFEIGIQTFDPAAQMRISRSQDNRKTEENLLWLRRHTNAHIHADLIAGLPGEDLQGFGASFDRLIALDPHEIQVGILKRLRGAPIGRHTEAFDMRYNPDPPYDILQTAHLAFSDIQRLKRFARYWDLIGNSGRFPRGRALLLGAAPFGRFLRFSDWLHAHTGKTHQIALDRLFDWVFLGLVELFGEDRERVVEALRLDFANTGLKSLPDFLRDHPLRRPNGAVAGAGRTHQRQTRHLGVEKPA